VRTANRRTLPAASYFARGFVLIEELPTHQCAAQELLGQFARQYSMHPACPVEIDRRIPPGILNALRSDKQSSAVGISALGLLSGMTAKRRSSLHEPVNLASPAFKANPFPFYARLRAQAPVVRMTMPTRDIAWLISRSWFTLTSGATRPTGRRPTTSVGLLSATTAALFMSSAG
jgi:hypothetical protein